MYIVKIHNSGVSIPIHDTKEKLTSGKVTKGINTIDSFQFSMLPSNAGWEGIHDYTTLVSVYNTNKGRYEFYGRVLYSEDTMSESGAIKKDVICESYFGFLCDSQQEYVAERNWTVRGLLEHIVNAHNSQVESYKQFVIGEVTVADPNDNLYCGIQWANTWEAINEKMIDTLGGEIRFRVDGDVIYLDYLEEIGVESSTEITLSRNMKSIAREKDPSEVITRLIPLGSKIEETEQRLEITSVNGGKNYIEDEEAVALYGVRVATVEFDDITIASNLLKRGLEWLAENNKVKVSYTATALDLSLIGLDVDDFDVCNYHIVKNPLLSIDDKVRIIKKSIDICEEVRSTIEFGDNIIKLSELMRKQASRIKWMNSRYATNDRVISEIDRTKNQINESVDNKLTEYASKDDIAAEVNSYIDSEAGTAKIVSALDGKYQEKGEYITTTELNTSVEQYLNTQEGKASIVAAVSGEYVKEDELTGYVEKTELSTEIGSYIDTAEGTAKIVSAAEGTYQKKSEMSGYVTTTTLNTSIGQYIDSTAGKAKIVSAVEGEFVTESDLSGYVKTTNLNTSIGQYIDSTTGKAKVVSAVSGTYQTIAGMSDYAKTTAVSTIEQSVSDVEAAITLSSTYTKNTIGTNVYALLQLVSNANSSTIKIKADKIDFTGFTTFVRPDDLKSNGTTAIDGGRITTGTISADRIDVDSLHVTTIYGTGTYDDEVLLTTSGAYVYVGGENADAAATYTYIMATNTIYFGGSTAKLLRLYMTDKSFGPESAGNTILGSTTYPWGSAYLGYYSGYYWKISSACIVPSATLTSSNTSYFNIGSSTYPITTLYVKHIDQESDGKLGFFGATPIAKQTLSTSSNNMSYSSATSSNYLYVLNNLVGILKNKYGLIA